MEVNKHLEGVKKEARDLKTSWIATFIVCIVVACIFFPDPHTKMGDLELFTLYMLLISISSATCGFICLCLWLSKNSYLEAYEEKSK